MQEQQLREAFELMKKGEKEQAMMIVRSVLREDRQNVDAWWLMANLLEDEEKVLNCLNQILELSPEHRGARKMLASLRPDFAENLSPTANPVKKIKGDIDKSKLNEHQGKDLIRLIIVTLGLIIGAAIVIDFITIPFYASYHEQPVVLGGPSPEEVVIIQFTAALNDDVMTMREYTCDRLESRWENLILRIHASMISSGINPMDVIFDMSELNVKELSHDRDSVVVDVTGDVIIRVNGVERRVNILDISKIEQARVNLTISNGHWVVCSY